ncbi:MAG: tRNA (adenosine(37)-N6)-threonylcarbamoyltransferase complex dimerization subunit type 1 TsaB [Cyclobacteriaceae bacterium]
MSLILSIETSTNLCGVAVHRDGHLISLFENHLEKSHSQFLTLLIEQCIHTADISYKDLSAVAISKGPGSYTGLRIGTSTAKGLCYALDIPLIAVPTLEAMAHRVASLQTEDCFLCPMIDARRMEVYCALYSNQLQAIQDVHAHIITETSFESYLAQKKVLFFGNGAAKCKDTIQHINANFLNGVHPYVDGIGKLATLKYLDQSFESTALFEPFYLKDFLIRKPSVKV